MQDASEIKNMDNVGILHSTKDYRMQMDGG
jgi:hypothetical protein